MQAELNELVEKLYPDCKKFYSKKGHILVTMIERRWQVKRGYNYEEVNCHDNVHFIMKALLSKA